MIDDLDRTIADLLKTQLASGLADQVAISFSPPDSEFPPATVTLPAIDLFLYDIRENMELRSEPWRHERTSGGVTRRHASVRIDCSYLVTAWANQGSTTPAYDEHRLLSEVMFVLLRYPVLPRALLLGDLRTNDAEPLPTATLQPGRLQSPAEFWQAIGGKPKASLNYLVTIAAPAGQVVEGESVVYEKVLRLRNISSERP
jgi:hypothetical protein